MLRDIDVYYGGGFSSGGAFYLIGSAGQTIMQWQLDSPHGASQHLETRQVIYGGESFEARSDSPVDVTVSGYLLHEPT